MGPDILHKHFIARIESNQKFKNPESIKEWMKELVKNIKMEILMGPFVEYCDQSGNEGVTGVVIIKTSHIAIHIWDECEPSIIQLDIYTCSHLDLNVVFEQLKFFSPSRIEYKFLDRENELTLLNEGKQCY